MVYGVLLSLLLGQIVATATFAVITSICISVSTSGMFCTRVSSDWVILDENRQTQRMMKTRTNKQENNRFFLTCKQAHQLAYSLMTSTYSCIAVDSPCVWLT